VGVIGGSKGDEKMGEVDKKRERERPFSEANP
jgi:hypothetical protein